MMLGEIQEINAWERAEHFHHFVKLEQPFYNVNLDLPVTGLKFWCSQSGRSLNSTLMWIVLKAMNELPVFRTRMWECGCCVRTYPTLSGSTTHLDQGGSLFRLVFARYEPDLDTFIAGHRQEIANSVGFYGNDQSGARDALVYFSPMPWYSFNAIDHVSGLDRADAIPRVTWGKIRELPYTELLPFNIRVNHCFVDALHLAILFQKIEEHVRTIIREEIRCDPKA